MLYDVGGADDVEQRETYVLGGFHPVHLGDTLNNRYKVLHKLGYGGFSTVWLARDLAVETYVAVKILIAKGLSTDIEGTETQFPPLSGKPHELEILEEINSLSSKHPGKAQIPFPPTTFTVCGPNGTHLCLVYEMFGPNLSTFQGRTEHSPIMARKVALQLTHAVAFLHSVGISHGDIKPQNVVPKVNHERMAAWSEEELYQRLGGPRQDRMVCSIHKNGEDIEIDLPASAPQYLVEPAMRTNGWQDVLVDDIKIVDFGEARLVQQYDGLKLGYTASYASPELMRNEGRSSRPGLFANEIWALACTIYELCAGEQLFSSCFGSNPDLIKAQWKDILGFLPKELDDNIGRALTEPREFVEEDGVIQGSLLHSVLEIGVEPDNQIPKKTSNPISPAEANLLHDLLSRMLRYQPEERLSAVEVSTHPWFSFVEREQDLQHKVNRLKSIEATKTLPNNFKPKIREVTIDHLESLMLYLEKEMESLKKAGKQKLEGVQPHSDIDGTSEATLAQKTEPLHVSPKDDPILARFVNRWKAGFIYALHHPSPLNR